MKNKKTFMVIMSDSDHRKIVLDELEKQKYDVLLATNNTEARLKFQNSSNDFLIIDEKMEGFHAKEFVQNIRRKEDSKSLKGCLPILIISEDAKSYHEKYKDIINCKFLEAPFKQSEFKKKLMTFSHNSSIITENTRVLKKGEYLINEGGVSNEMYWVISGEFMITKLNQDDQNVMIGKVLPGELVGEMSFLDSLPRSASVRAEEDAEVLVIPHKKFIDIFDNQPAWFRSLMRTLSTRLRTANQMMARKQVVTDQDEVDTWAEEEKIKGV